MEPSVCILLFSQHINSKGAVALKQHASRFMLIFMKTLEKFLKVNYCEVNKNSNLHIAIGTEKFQKVVNICKNSP
jgi:hypothetical protein